VLRLRSTRLLLGVAIFGATAGVTTFFNLESFPAGRLGLSIVAAFSAGLSFAVVYWRDWRARSIALPPRAVVLGVTVVLGAHFLFGLGFYLLVVASTLFGSEPADFPHLFAIGFSFLFAGGASLLHLPVTILAGICAALAFELMDRMPDPDPVE